MSKSTQLNLNTSRNNHNNSQNTPSQNSSFQNLTKLPVTVINKENFVQSKFVNSPYNIPVISQSQMQTMYHNMERPSNSFAAGLISRYQRSLSPDFMAEGSNLKKFTAFNNTQFNGGMSQIPQLNPVIGNHGGGSLTSRKENPMNKSIAGSS